MIPTNSNWISFIAFSIIFSIDTSAASAYWGCSPQNKLHDDPRILFGEGSTEDSLILVLDKDFKRPEGIWPKGTYKGSLKLSQSGFSKIAQVDVDAHFPNKLTNPKGSYFMRALSVKQAIAVSEAYLMWPTENSETTGFILNEYACRKK